MINFFFYDCTNYYFEIEGEDGIKRYGKSLIVKSLFTVVMPDLIRKK